MTTIGEWLEGLSLLALGLGIFLSMAAAAFIGFIARHRRGVRLARQSSEDDRSEEAYVMSGVLGLLALLLGFTFALSVDRFEARRGLVLEEANAIGTSYLRAQLLDEPHRTRMSTILLDYTENRIILATAHRDKVPALLQKNDALLVDLWSATAAAFDGVKASPFSASLLDTVNQVIDLDASRKAARQVRVPTEVFVVLIIYSIVTAGILGYVLVAKRGAVVTGILFLLISMSLMLVVDLDRPASGNIIEAQEPMIALRDALRKQPPGSFDRWRVTRQGRKMVDALGLEPRTR